MQFTLVATQLFEDLACRYGLGAKAGSPANNMGTKLFGPTYAYIIYILYHVSYDEYNGQIYHAQGFIQEGGGGAGISHHAQGFIQDSHPRILKNYYNVIIALNMVYNMTGGFNKKCGVVS